LSYSVVPLPPVTAVEETVTSTPEPPAPETPRRIAADLEEAEATARLLLHERKADVQFTPQITRQDDRVRVRMIVDNDEQHDEWHEALSRIPGVSADVWTPDSAPAVSIPAEAGDSAHVVALYRTSAPRADDLARCLGSNARAMAFIDDVHNHVRAALVPSLALERLSKRYADGEMRERPAVEEKLRRIANDDWAEAGRQVSQLVAVIRPVLSQCISPRELPSAPAARSLEDHGWRVAGLALANQIRDLDAYFNQLFTTRITAKAPATEEEAIDRLISLADELQQTVFRPKEGDFKARRDPE
jgi:hypothetical protein